MSLFLANESSENASNAFNFDEIVPFLETLNQVILVIGVTDTVLGLLFNGLLLVAVLSCRKLRQDARNVLLLNVAVGDLLVVVVEQPLKMATRAYPGWGYGCQVHLAVQMLTLFAFNFLSVWGVVCLDLLLLLRLAGLDLPALVTSALTTTTATTGGLALRGRLRRAGLVTAVALPWLTAVLVVTPVVWTGLHAATNRLWTTSRCSIVLYGWALLTLNILFFFLPCLLVLMLLLLAGCLRRSRRRRVGTVATEPSPPPTLGFGSGNTSPHTPQSASSSSSFSSLPEACRRQQSPSLTPYVLGTCLTFLLLGPRHVHNLASRHDLYRMPLRQWLTVSFVLDCLSELKSTCLPLLWLLAFPDLRARACHLLVSAGRFFFRAQDVRPQVDLSVSYRNLQA